jgi:hypothetical protein
MVKQDDGPATGPVFLGGLDSTGKTSLGLALSAHPNIAIVRRTYTWRRFFNRYGSLAEAGNFERCLADLLRQKAMRLLHPDPDRLRREFFQGEPTYGRFFDLIHSHHAERLGKRRWGEQLGLAERHAAEIFAAFPRAKMLHMIRDPWSRYQEVVGRSRRRIGKVGQATAAWLFSAHLSHVNERRYASQYKIVRYEDWLEDREGVLRDICWFLNEDFDEQMLAPLQAPEYPEARSQSAASRRAGTKNRGATADRAQPASARELAFMQSMAGAAMADHGYGLSQVRLSWPQKLSWYLVDWPVNALAMTSWNFANR